MPDQATELLVTAGKKQKAKNVRIAVIPIDLFDESEENANVMDDLSYQSLVRRIQKVGFLQPLLSVKKPDGRYGVVDGNHRLRAAREAGLKKLPSLIADMDALLARAEGLGMNKDRGDLDMGMAAQILRGLAQDGYDAEDLELTGFRADELSDLLRSAEDGLSDVEDDLLERRNDGAAEDDSESMTYSVTLEFESSSQRKFFRKALKRASHGAGNAAGALGLAESFLEEKAPR